ncbi:hypothetical protein ACYJ1Y_02720 [Natrialbaceae archaeon A-gly3]
MSAATSESIRYRPYEARPGTGDDERAQQDEHDRGDECRLIDHI